MTKSSTGRKTFIVDTSVLLYDKCSIHSFPGNDVVIPLIVLDELDRGVGAWAKRKPDLAASPQLSYRRINSGWDSDIGAGQGNTGTFGIGSSEIVCGDQRSEIGGRVASNDSTGAGSRLSANEVGVDIWSGVSDSWWPPLHEDLVSSLGRWKVELCVDKNAKE